MLAIVAHRRKVRRMKKRTFAREDRVGSSGSDAIALKFEGLRERESENYRRRRKSKQKYINIYIRYWKKEG